VPEVIWLLDRYFWGVVWAREQHLVCRVRHLQRLVRAPDVLGRWRETKVERYGYRLLEMARVQTKLRVRLGKQRRAKKQPATVKLYAGPMQVAYLVGRKETQEPQTKDVWLVRAQVLGTNQCFWLITDHPVETAEEALRVFQMYRMRWSIEDAFKFIKQSLGWEEVQVLALDKIRFLVAMAAVAAGFLFRWGVTLESEAVQLLARAGGWIPKKGERAGKIVLSRGLRRLLDFLAMQALLEAYVDEHGQLPQQIAAFLPDDFW
jgi:hypothetical protein